MLDLDMLQEEMNCYLWLWVDLFGVGCKEVIDQMFPIPEPVLNGSSQTSVRVS